MGASKGRRIGVRDKSRQTMIVAAREAGRSYEDIARQWGITRERVRQLLQKDGRSDLCGPGLMTTVNVQEQERWITRGAQPGTMRRADIRVSQILAMRRRWQSWQKIGAAFFPEMPVNWAARRVRRDVEFVCNRYRLDPSAAFYNLHTIRKRQKARSL